MNDNEDIVYELMQAATCRKEIHDAVLKVFGSYNRDQRVRDIAKRFCDKYWNICFKESGRVIDEISPAQVTRFSKELIAWYTEEYNPLATN